MSMVSWVLPFKTMGLCMIIDQCNHSVGGVGNWREGGGLVFFGKVIFWSLLKFLRVG